MRYLAGYLPTAPTVTQVAGTPSPNPKSLVPEPQSEQGLQSTLNVQNCTLDFTLPRTYTHSIPPPPPFSQEKRDINALHALYALPHLLHLHAGRRSTLSCKTPRSFQQVLHSIIVNHPLQLHSLPNGPRTARPGTSSSIRTGLKKTRGRTSRLGRPAIEADY